MGIPHPTPTPSTADTSLSHNSASPDPVPWSRLIMESTGPPSGRNRIGLLGPCGSYLSSPFAQVLLPKSHVRLSVPRLSVPQKPEKDRLESDPHHLPDSTPLNQPVALISAFPLSLDVMLFKHQLTFMDLRKHSLLPFCPQKSCYTHLYLSTHSLSPLPLTPTIPQWSRALLSRVLGHRDTQGEPVKSAFPPPSSPMSFAWSSSTL